MELGDKLKRIKQVAQTNTLTPKEADDFARLIDSIVSEIREAFKYWRDEGDVEGFCAYVRWRLETSLTSKIRKDIQERKAA